MNKEYKSITTKKNLKRKCSEITSIWDEYKYKDNERNNLNELIKKYKDGNNLLGWVSASRTKNYLLNDQMVDWLTCYYSTIGINPEKIDETTIKENKELLKDASHIDILFEGGNVFEQMIFKELKDIYKDDFVLVFDEDDMIKYREEKSISKWIKQKNEYVRKLMISGTPLIAQAPLINENNKTYGVADILIRSDYLNIVFNKFFPDSDINIKAPLLKMAKNQSYHYRVIDCKWTTMVLCVDGLTIRNEAMIPAYKGQIAVYTAALESLQGYVPNYGYIMAKGWRIDKTNIPIGHENLYKGSSAFDRVGVINYGERDKDYLMKTKLAVQWLQKVVTEGREWRYNLDKPTNKELYPNMNKSLNPVYEKVKDKLARRYGDPTMVWYVGQQNREILNKNGIYDIRDPKCTIEKLGIKRDSPRGRIIEQIIDINKHNQKTDYVRPAKIDNNLWGWKDANILDYYIDFETINYNLYVNPLDMDIDKSYIDSDVTFMIGIGFKQSSEIDTKMVLEALNIDKTKCDYYINVDLINKWEFVCLHLVKFDLKNELEMFRLFYQFINIRHVTYSTRHNCYSRFFHWTAAEIRFINKANRRIQSGEYTKYYMNKENSNIQETQKELDKMISNFNETSMWIDMCKIFEMVPIVVKGSYRFKLKHIGNAFYKNGLILTKWADGKMSDGFRAMIEAIKLYRTEDMMTYEDRTYKEIIDYNEIDCKIVYEIVNYLRVNH